MHCVSTNTFKRSAAIPSYNVLLVHIFLHNCFIDLDTFMITLNEEAIGCEQWTLQHRMLPEGEVNESATEDQPVYITVIWEK